MAGRLSDGERPSAAPASTEGSAVDQEVTEGGQVLALALTDVGHDLSLGRDGVGLQVQVVVGDGLVLALDSLEKLVGGLLNSVGDLDQHGLLLGSHGGVLVLDQLAILLASLLVIANDTGQHL